MKKNLLLIFTILLITSMVIFIIGCGNTKELPVREEVLEKMQTDRENTISYPEDKSTNEEPSGRILVGSEDLVLYSEVQFVTATENYEDIAVEFIETWGNMLLSASEELPDNTYAIEGFRIEHQPEITHISMDSIETRGFVFKCIFSVKPIHFDTTPWWAGTAWESENDPGWIVIPMEYLLHVDFEGNVTYIEHGVFGDNVKGYIQL